MQTRFKATTPLGMPIMHVLSRRHLEIAFAYLAGYVLLDWLSYLHPFASFGITPWNPPTGLSFALVLLFGSEFLPWLFAAPVLADALVRGLPLPLWVEAAAALIIGGGYSIGAGLLLLSRLKFDPTLGTRTSLLLLLTTAVVSTAVVTAGYVGMLVVSGILPGGEFARAALRFWIGEVIGVTVLTPFLLILATRRWTLRPSWELGGLLVVILAALGGVFGLADSFRFQLFYLFFLPIVWTAVRFGLEGVSAALVITQVGLITAIHFAEPDAGNVTAYQALMAVLAFTGLAVGVLMSEQQRTQRQLRINQEALNRALRLSTMGEFAAALAHEINQPLTAVANYARVAKSATDPGVASEAAARVIAQVERAAEVVRRLRNFIRLGRSETGPAMVREVLEDALGYCHADLDRYGVMVRVDTAPDLPQVHVDVLQIEQVIVNLVRNAAEALSEAGRYDGKVVIEAAREDDDRVVIRVRDNGPGFDADLFERASLPFTTTKEDGLGLGLSLARSIVEAHGGRLTIASTSSGATVSFTLQTVATPQEASAT
jgi:two-component system, LuxR family, sensor kinase FixL